jgi:hypothetical protein
VTATLIVAAVLLAAVSSGLSLSYLRRVMSLGALGARDLARSLGRLPIEQRLGELERRAPEGWARELARDLVAAPGEAERVAITNDALADVAHRLDEGAGWPAAGLRISAFGALLVAAIALLVQRMELILPVLAIGGAGALASLEIGRRGRSLAARQREGLDALIETVVVLADPSAPTGGSWSRRSRRGPRSR